MPDCLKPPNLCITIRGHHQISKRNLTECPRHQMDCLCAVKPGSRVQWNRLLPRAIYTNVAGLQSRSHTHSAVYIFSVHGSIQAILAVISLGNDIFFVGELMDDYNWSKDFLFAVVSPIGISNAAAIHMRAYLILEFSSMPP